MRTVSLQVLNRARHRKVTSLSACYFQTFSPGENGTRYYIEPETLKIPLTSCPNGDEAGSDIAFVRLKEAVREIEPYAVFEGDERYERFNFVDKAMTKVSAVNSRFRNFPDRTMSINDGCVIDQIHSESITFSLASKCSTDEGNSGAGNFFIDGDRRPVLFGVTSFTSRSEFDGQPYGSNNFTLAAPLRGKILRELQSEAARH